MEIKVKIVKLFVRGYLMKKFACVMITTLAIGSVLTACSEEKEETKVETNSQLDISNSFKKDGSGVDTSTKVTLDGEAISLPNDTSSAELKPGEHTLSIETTDIVGNTSIKTIVFSTATEMPNAPEILLPEGSTLEDTDVDLKVKVTDPTADKLKVQLYEGFKYLPKDDNITTYANTSLTEPPKQVISDNDQIITEEEKISERDVNI